MIQPALSIVKLRLRTTIAIINGSPVEQHAVEAVTAQGLLYEGILPSGNHNNSTISKLIDAVVTPHLCHRSFKSWSEAAHLITTLNETILETRILPAESPRVSSSGRRRLLRGLQPETQRTVSETFERAHPLPPALVWALQIALLRAAADLFNDTPVGLFGNMVDATGEADRFLVGVPPETAASPLIFNRIDQIVIEIQAEGGEKAYGKQAQHLQRYVRQLGGWIKQMGSPNSHFPQLVVRLNGVLGQIYNHNPGKILGAIVGLEKAVEPIELTLIDPVILDEDGVEVDEVIKTLQEYMKLRQLNSTLRRSHDPEKKAGTVVDWNTQGGLLALTRLGEQPFDFVVPAGLNEADLFLLLDLFSLLPLRSLWLPAHLESVALVINRLNKEN